MQIVVVGSGGHAKVVIATARAAGMHVVGVVDDAPARWGELVLGVKVDGPCAVALDDPAVVAVLAIGNNAVRARLAATARCAFATVVHPSAVVHASVTLGPGTVVFAGAVVQPDTRIGAHGILNTRASVDHDCVIGAHVHIAPGASLAGTVTLGDGVFMGIGSVAIPGVTVGEWSIVGAGAAVVRSLPSRVTAVGVPAKVPGHPP